MFKGIDSNFKLDHFYEI